MRVYTSPGSIKKFWRTPWRFQRTFETPLKTLEPFTATIVAALDPIETASVIVDGYVFRPKRLDALLASNSLSLGCVHDDIIEATGAGEGRALLQATLSDWVDFLLVPYPKPLVIYADHDEFITFFANSKSNLNRVVIPLIQNGVREVSGYERTAKK